MRYRIVFCVFVLVGFFLFVPFIRAGEDHGQALIEKLGIHYGECTEVLAITPRENKENVQLATMEMIETTIDYIGLKMGLPATLVGPENLYCVQDGFVKNGINGVHYINMTSAEEAAYYKNPAGLHKGTPEFFEQNGSYGQISTTLKNGWFGVKFFLLGNQYMQIAVCPTDSVEQMEKNRTAESIDLVNVPDGYMNVVDGAEPLVFGESKHSGDGITIYAYTPELNIIIQYYDAPEYVSFFKRENRGVYVYLDRQSVIVESAKNMIVFTPEGKPRAAYFGYFPGDF